MLRDDEWLADWYAAGNEGTVQAARAELLWFLAESTDDLGRVRRADLLECLALRAVGVAALGLVGSWSTPPSGVIPPAVLWPGQVVHYGRRAVWIVDEWARVDAPGVWVDPLLQTELALGALALDLGAYPDVTTWVEEAVRAAGTEGDATLRLLVAAARIQQAFGVPICAYSAFLGVGAVQAPTLRFMPIED